MRYLTFYVILLFLSFNSKSQILFPESFVVIFDSTKHFKGSVSPSIEIKTQKNLYVEITNRADFVYKFQNHAFTVASKFEQTSDGDETIISGGFIYAKYKTHLEQAIIPEYYVQYQWAEARGLDKKIAAGANLRYKIFKNQGGGAFFGIGAFFEDEIWTFRGVPDDRVPVNNSERVQTNWKINTYLSSKKELSEKVKAEAAIYLQDKITKLFQAPRWAGSIGITYSFTKNIALSAQFRTIYDPQPLVPIDKLWINTFSALEVTF